MAEFSHPELGKIKGIRDEKVLSFRGLKYASLEHGFSDPMPLSNKADGVVDARTHGLVTHICPDYVTLLTFCFPGQQLSAPLSDVTWS